MGGKKFLIGNAFPLSLIRGRKVLIEEVSIDVFKSCVKGAVLVSFWGHENTLEKAEEFLGVSIKPIENRPSIRLSERNLPMIYGEEYKECWIVSPNYDDELRHEIGCELGKDVIHSWSILKLIWLDK